MAIQDKYQSVIDTINQSGGRNLSVKEEGGVLKVSAIVRGPNEKKSVWNKIKEIGGENPSDISADITMDNVENEMAASTKSEDGKGLGSSGKTYTVKSGDSLSKIAKECYGDASKYMDIFNANKDKLSDPDKIKPGQELMIP